MLPSLAITLTRTLADDPRNQLEFWLEEAATAARGMCSEHDFSGALTLAATDRVWAAYPGNVTNFADVIANGDAPKSVPDPPGPCPTPWMLPLVLPRLSSGDRLRTATTPTMWLVPASLQPYWPVLAKPTGHTSKVSCLASLCTPSFRAK